MQGFLAREDVARSLLQQQQYQPPEPELVRRSAVLEESLQGIKGALQKLREAGFGEVADAVRMDELQVRGPW